MHTNQKRIAIAEACGIKLEYIGGCAYLYPAYAGQPREERELPSYFTDLNACAQMRKILKPSKQLEFIANLRYILKIPWWPADDLAEAQFAEFSELDATATQQCEAFGLTLRLWEKE